MLGERGTRDTHKPHLAGPLPCGRGALSLLQFTKTAALSLAGGRWMDPGPKPPAECCIELAGWARTRREESEVWKRARGPKLRVRVKRSSPEGMKDARSARAVLAPPLPGQLLISALCRNAKDTERIAAKAITTSR
ncbi:hypothetical protein NDU88_004424 [Pleurodeles waltl]|uniref:Uncharacterized protein n=1 Tax=Pleurodeles waltl TaxID=8319 RepID=A0AAV7T7S0_PLEWA|nr:hypothetical protein NDU88_004424 [Pleurodeles waltl]